MFYQFLINLKLKIILIIILSKVYQNIIIEKIKM